MDLNSPLNALDQIFSSQEFEVDNADYLEFEKKVYFLERLAEVENSSVTVLDLYQKKYIFLRSRYIEPFDNPLIDHDPQDPMYYSKFIHPDDLPIVMDSYKKSFRFFLSRPEKLPIYRKEKEIFDIVIKISDLIPENDEHLKEVKSCMLSDAALLTVKVAGAETAGLYDLKMENAAIIRKAARDLMIGIGPFDKDPDDDIPFNGFEEDPKE